MRGKLGIALSLMLCASMVLTVLPTGTHAAPASSGVLLDEGAEQSTYEEWNVRWERWDDNNDATSGQDWWCRQMHEVHSGQRSIYCARNGENSHYLNATGHHPWNVNITSENDSVPQTNYILRYDTNQDSIMHRPITGAQYYDTVTLTFWFYSDTGASDARQPDSGELVGYDFLNALYYTGSGESRVKHVLWTISEEQATSKAWTQVTLNVPNTATMIGFEFVSGTTPPTGGDAPNALSSYGIRTYPLANSTGMKEGVFLDDISVVGTDPRVVPLITAVDPLPTYQANASFPVRFSDSGPQTPMKWVDLYYRTNGTGAWIKYTTPSKPDGKFTSSPITFVAPQDGKYEFFTLGVDQNDVSEPRRDAPDTNTTVDTVAPSTELTVTGEGQANNYTGAVSLSLRSADTTSGVDRIMYRLHGEDWTTYTGSIGIATNGTNTIEYYSVDRAGNGEDTKSYTFTVAGANEAIVFQENDGTYADGNITIEFAVATGYDVDKLEYSLDGEAFVEIASNATSVSFTGLSNGAHSLIIRAGTSIGSVIQGETNFTVGEAPSTGGILGDIIDNPAMLIGLIAVAVAAVGGAAWFVLRKRRS
ncbi:MAG: hypothetical protein ISF22_10950 [Methanomassiliicoccus sp.]|nr:hypothetical protein [Methanomassiliicoccus sp.]